MFKLPICPHCGTIYRYGDVKKSAFKKSEKCYHCKKIFIVSRIKMLLLCVIVVTLAAVINIAELYMTPSLNIVMLLVTNIILIIIGILFIPFFISFKKGKNNAITDKKK